MTSSDKLTNLATSLITVEMTKKNTQPATLSAQELQLIERLREHPDLMERFQSILELSANADGPVKSADEVEGLLIEDAQRAAKRLEEQYEEPFRLLPSIGAEHVVAEADGTM